VGVLKKLCCVQQATGCDLRTITIAGPSGLPTAQSYASCQPLNVGDGTFRLLYSVIDNGNGTSTLHGAYTITTTGWAGFGLPGPSGLMLQGSAVIAKPCSSCPSGAQTHFRYWCFFFAVGLRLCYATRLGLDFAPTFLRVCPF
jgi:hypothetical protein